MDIPGFFFLRFFNMIFKKTYSPGSRFADWALFQISFRKCKNHVNFA